MDTIYTISQLAAAAGITHRTIRYYTTEGLLPPPIARGKYAHYSAEHLLRLRLIARMKALYLPLSEIKARVVPLPADELAQMLDAYEQRGIAAASDPPLERAEQAALPPATSGAEAAPAATTPAPRSGGLLSRLMPRLREQPAPAGETWQRVTLAPGVELHLREPLSSEQRAHIDRLIAQARELFG